ncbi:MAG: CARDB domain-containing protein [Prolixibacteraceae bacterium]
MKKYIPNNSQLPFSEFPVGLRKNKWSLHGLKLKIIQTIVLALLAWVPMSVTAALTLPAIPSNSYLAKKFELSTEMVFRIKVGENYLTSGALIAYINGEIRGAQTASVNFPATGINVFKTLVFNDKSSGDQISFKYYDIFADKIYDITENIEFIPDLVPDYANPAILTAFCKPITIVTGLIPENGKENLNSTLDLFWQPSPNTSSYQLFIWEDGASVPATPTNSNIYNTTIRVYNLKYGQVYRWKIKSVNDCSSVESDVQTFKIRQLPDLTVTEVTAPASIESGSNFDVSFKVKNSGIGNTAGVQWYDAIYASTDQTLSNDDKLLTTKINFKQLEADSTYSQTVSVMLPIDFTGNYYFLVKTDVYNSVAELLEDNNVGKTAAATTVSLKTLPDIRVTDIQAEATTVNPGDSLKINWKVENIGGVSAVGGWSERITIVPVSGDRIIISPNTEYKLPLASLATLNRSRKIKLPEVLKFSGDANIEVELIPYPELIEYAASKANNIALSAGKITVARILSLTAQTTSVLENVPNPIRFIVNRSGISLADLVVTLTPSTAGQLTIPATVTIPANQSAIAFNVVPVNNLLLDGSRTVDITASAASYSNAVKTMTILDDEIPSLTPVLSKNTATEGETIVLSVSRDLVTAEPLTVNLSTNKPAQWTFPSSVTIPANTNSSTVSVAITDDIIPELTADAVIYASSAGVKTGQVTASIADNDVPQVSLEILTDTVSESAGVYATWGIIKRVKGDDIIKVNLSSNLPNALFFPASITLPKGAAEQQFNIGVVDNGDVDGYRKVTITGSVYVSSCNCGTTPDNGGTVNADLVIADNDGPSLSVSILPISLPEGKLNAGTLTISRNTPTTDALDVKISHGDASEVDIQTTATIPAGQKSVQVPVNTINDGIEDGNQMVSVQASATSFSTGFGYVFVTDLNKPDMVITDIILNKSTAATNDVIEISGSAFNEGFATAPSGVKINFYYSKNNSFDASDILLGDFTFPSTILQNTAANFMKAVEVPDETGNFYILGKINPEEQITELAYFNNVSDAVALTITPEYNATAIADNTLYLPNTTIPIHGSALNSSSEKVPNVDVDVYILSNGTRKELKAKTDNLGDYSVDFVPVPNESGHYTIGACFPKQNLSATQDEFDIPGLKRESSAYIIWNIKQGVPITGKIGITNTSNSALNKIVIKADKLPAGCELAFDTIPSLSGNETKEFNFTLQGKLLSTGKDYEIINLTVSTNEGVKTEFPAYYYCQALTAQLKSDPASINTTMTKGTSRLLELHIINNGAGATGLVTVSLPKVDWMSLVSPATIENMLPNDTATVIINLTPTADVPLNTPISGSIVANCVNGNGVSVPYRIEAVSEATGGLKVDVIDEYTYYTDAKPHVKNAHVVVRHPFSGKIIADGFTDENGIFSVDNLPEGSYKMTVEADKHEGFQTTLIIDPGRINEQTIFLSFQAITYTWEVVPTEIEDKYEVQLIMKFETNVPVPVVIVEMPKEMPQLFNDETYPFLVTMTNKGLITAKDVQLTLPQNDPEYIFITNFSKLDLLAQQAIQVPVVMKRRDSLKSGTISNSLESTAATGPCTDYAVTIYGWECGKDKKWHQTSNGITFTGRICPSTGVPGGGGWGPGYGYGPGGPGGGGSYYYDPYNGVPSISAPEIGCDKCMIDIAFAILGCVKLHPYVALAVNVAGCAYSALDGEVTAMDVFNCLIGFTPAKYARDGYKCALGIANAAKTCYEDPPSFQRAQLKAATSSKMPPILKQAVKDLEAFLYFSDAMNAYVDEMMGSADWQEKESFNDFAKSIEPFTSTMKPIEPADLVTIQNAMIGTDMSAAEISAFAQRWNSAVEAQGKNILSPNAEYPNIPDQTILMEYLHRIDTVQNYALSRGFTGFDELYSKSLETIEEQVNGGRSSVCSSVTINITQKVVMTREAFEGTLTIFNGNTTTAMKDIKLDLEIRDENGVLSNDLFQIETKALSILTGIDGTGTLGPNEKGSATVLFIPEKGAAPEIPKSYSFGGSFSYLDPFTGVTVTKPLFPVTLDVNPSPDLWLHYFMSRDILGDDALTLDKVEPIVPAEFAVMVQNNGFGIAKNVRIESAQPKIVENEKGLAINFALIGSNLNGKPKQLGLTNIDFGNIAPKTSTIGQWWFTSDLLGHFISYETKLTHLDSRGNPDLSLISGATLHELIRSIRVYSIEDNINDFLVNEVQDAKEFPDVIYLSGGGILDVYPAVSQSTSGNIASAAHEIELLVTPDEIGWNYIKFSDPGNGNYKLTGVTREDGQVIPLDNVWQTFVTLPDGKEPVYENMMHFIDIFATATTQKYILKFSLKDQTYPEIDHFEGIPTAAVTEPVTSVNVVFKYPIDPATFNYEDMVLRIQGGADVMDNTVTVTQINPTTYKIDLTSKSVGNGYYVLTVQAAEISNPAGTKGVSGKQTSWTQFISIPAISEFIGLPANQVGAPFDNLLIRFNMPIDKTTLLPERFFWTRNYIPVSGTVVVTPMDTEGQLFQLSGLQAFLSQDGRYELTVDLPKIKSLDGANGIISQFVNWEIDQTPATVAQIIPSTDGGYDSQHRTAFTIQFNEGVKGFGLNALELWKDGLRQPLSQLNLSVLNDSNYLVTQFRLLTYYEGSYELKVKLADITDDGANSRTDTVKYNWIVFRTKPQAVTNLKISPDMGFSDSDGITATKTLTASMTVNEPNTRIELYQTDQVNPILLAEADNVPAGPLSLPVTFSYTGNVTLQAYCIDSFTNQSITEIPVFIDETALVSTWKDAPLAAVLVQPTSLQLEFSDKLLDDTKLKENLKFERDGQLLGNENLTITKSTDKIYAVSGMNLAGNASGTYSLSLDNSKFKKYLSGKEGISTSKAQWAVSNPNKAPNAFAGLNQTVDENSLVTLNGSGSSDPDNDALTYLWTAPSGISLSSATAANPTFTAPEVNADQTYTFSLVVNDGKVNSAASTVNITVKNITSEKTQTLNLNIGWNIISAMVSPANPDMKAIFQSLIDAGKLVKVMDESGKTLEDFGAFGGWKNNIGNLSNERGYKVNVSEPVDLAIQGIPVTLPAEITLYEGWNIIGFPSETEQDAMSLFQPLIDSGKLIKVMNEAGLTIEDFGIFGGWKNNIGNLKPNKGYKVNMAAAGTITIPASGTKLAVIPPEVIPSQHFRKVFIGNGTDHVNINLVDLTRNKFEVGDEIGIFDGMYCVGSATIGSGQLFNDYISIPASGDDQLSASRNGYLSGNQIVLKLFRNNHEYVLTPKLENNSTDTFIAGESMFATANTILVTNTENQFNQNSVRCFPNPFTDQITIEIAISETPKLDVRIYDVKGRLIRNLYQGKNQIKTILIWDGKNDQGAKILPGNYVLKANDKVEKILLTR